MLDGQIDLVIDAIEGRRFERAREISESTYQRTEEMKVRGRDSIYLAAPLAPPSSPKITEP